MTSEYRRDHEPFPGNDEYERLNPNARLRIRMAMSTLNGFFGEPEASESETRAAHRALARYLIDSGKASAAGEV